jgi:hypothetical protein
VFRGPGRPKRGFGGRLAMSPVRPLDRANGGEPPRNRRLSPATYRHRRHRHHHPRRCRACCRCSPANSSTAVIRATSPRRSCSPIPACRSAGRSSGESSASPRPVRCGRGRAQTVLQQSRIETLGRFCPRRASEGSLSKTKRFSGRARLCLAKNFGPQEPGPLGDLHS